MTQQLPVTSEVYFPHWDGVLCTEFNGNIDQIQTLRACIAYRTFDISIKTELSVCSLNVILHMCMRLSRPEISSCIWQYQATVTELQLFPRTA